MAAYGQPCRALLNFRHSHLCHRMHISPDLAAPKTAFVQCLVNFDGSNMSAMICNVR